MLTQIGNGLISARISHKGAELTSLFHQGHRLEYVWGADPKFWPKSSPVLFPIVGALKGGEFIYRDKAYSLPRHGFARDHVFEVESKAPTRAVFLLRDNESTLRIFPFKFELRLIYELTGFELKVTYEVTNVSGDTMYFSIGGHPAFKVPLVDGTEYEDYFLKFAAKENADRWPITNDGLISSPSVPTIKNDDVLPLTKSLFYNDALVFRNLDSTMISLRSHRHAHGLDFSFQGFPFFGIWAFKDADFVCLEPWSGIADSITHDRRIENKEGIVELAGEEVWARTWSVKCF